MSGAGDGLVREDVRHDMRHDERHLRRAQELVEGFDPETAGDDVLGGDGCACGAPTDPNVQHGWMACVDSSGTIERTDEELDALDCDEAWHQRSPEVRRRWCPGCGQASR